MEGTDPQMQEGIQYPFRVKGGVHKRIRLRDRVRLSQEYLHNEAQCHKLEREEDMLVTCLELLHNEGVELEGYLDLRERILDHQVRHLDLMFHP
jgi:hypothetical protein